MPLKIHRVLQTLAALAFLLFGLGIVNTMVSLKYEIEDKACISVVNGRNLCQALRYNWVGLGTAVASIVALAFVKIKPSN
ncbi:hypothetical protein MON38_08010 [Hymenobacter sp. DH14]|uniref:Uncharacterized protein n=1 Tax=Hymenobacter cyanobacteriorum TaxID=2926463 RepID=A0A9X1VJC0_9BACT|nr:hypothetical protein [Hymenobacter cyanobacteriorum]MCI1187361.1 hypothetical protein [Hymenobacter cyanobacteriorum]